MKRALQFLSISLLTFCSVSCLKSDDPTPTPYTYISGVYVLNNGSWGANNSNLVMYDYTSEKATDDIFSAKNDRKLGDLGQDLLIYGSKMYIAVSGSGVVFVTDLTGKILGEVKAGENGNFQPRYLTYYEGNVYISYYEGYVGRIDTVNFNLSLSDNIGPNPEGLAVASKKLYVSVSNGLNYPDYDSTVVVMDPLSLVVKDELTVGLNPGKMVSCGDLIYCICNGNYGDVPSSMSIIQPDDEGDKTSTSKYVDKPQFISSDNTRYLFIVTNTDGNYRIMVYDTYIGLPERENLITDGTLFTNSITSVDIDPVNYYLFVGTSDYVNNGDIYVFNTSGTLYKKFDTNGINPQCVRFTQETKYITY